MPLFKESTEPLKNYEAQRFESEPREGCDTFLRVMAIKQRPGNVALAIFLNNDPLTKIRFGFEFYPEELNEFITLLQQLSEPENDDRSTCVGDPDS